MTLAAEDAPRRMKTPSRGLWPLEKIEYVQWLSYCGASKTYIRKHVGCSPGVLARHLNADVRALAASVPSSASWLPPSPPKKKVDNLLPSD